MWDKCIRHDKNWGEPPALYKRTSLWGGALDVAENLNDVMKDKSLEKVSCEHSLPRCEPHNVC
jgi:hypothetical protein